MYDLSIATPVGPWRFYWCKPITWSSGKYESYHLAMTIEFH